MGLLSSGINHFSLLIKRADESPLTEILGQINQLVFPRFWNLVASVLFFYGD